jgi:diacylglycerol O-acyltransferase / wax synthase
MAIVTREPFVPVPVRPGDRPLDWGAEREMNALEALMWRAEADPRLRSTICMLDLLDVLPDWGRFVAAHEWASRLVPRFRQRVIEPLLGLGLPYWSVDPDFDLHYHVRHIRLPEPGGWDELLSATEQIAMTPFDRARSPWEAYLFEGLAEGGAGYLLKMHHSATDGLGAVQLLSQLHSHQREPMTDKPQPPPPVPDATTPTEHLVHQVVQDARLGAGHLLDGASRGLRALAHPDRSLREAVDFASSLARVMGGDAGEGSPLLGERSMSWRFLCLDVAFADFRAASKAAGSTLNDAFIAALLGGFRRYHEAFGVEVESIPMAVPISVRRATDAEGGNHFAGARLAGPMGIADPAKRMHAISRGMKKARDEVAIDGLGLFAPALSRLPGPVISQLAGGMTKNNDLQASNVPGLREDVFIAGAKIERSYGFGPLPGCAAMVALISHGETCCVAANVDPAAITDPTLFERCLYEGFSEVLELAPGTADPVLRARG